MIEDVFRSGEGNGVAGGIVDCPCAEIPAIKMPTDNHDLFWMFRAFDLCHHIDRCAKAREDRAGRNFQAHRPRLPLTLHFQDAAKCFGIWRRNGHGGNACRPLPICGAGVREAMFVRAQRAQNKTRRTALLRRHRPHPTDCAGHGAITGTFRGARHRLKDDDDLSGHIVCRILKGLPGIKERRFGLNRAGR